MIELVTGVCRRACDSPGACAAVARVAEDKRPEFKRLMKAAQRSGPIDQDHVFYFEHYGNALARKVTRATAGTSRRGCRLPGRRCAAAA